VKPVKPTLPILLLSLAAACAGCFVPSAVVRLYPDDPGAVWRDGRGIINRQSPDCRMAVAFDHLADDKIVLRLEAQNMGARPLDLDPLQLAFTTCTGPHVCAPPRRVLDPEAALIALDQAQARERASQENAAVVGGALLLLDTAAAVSSVASGKPGHAAAFMEQGAATVALTSAASNGAQANIDRMQIEKQNWAAVALRRTTLFPGQGLAGFVYLPIDPAADKVWLRVHLVGLDEVWFPFKQVVIGEGAQ
jgi:hypothetical protein